MIRAYRSLIEIGLLAALLAAACTAQTPAVPAPTLDATATTVQDQASEGSVSASVEIQPAQQADLGFVIAAPVKQIDVKEGDQVKAGQALLVLDTPELEYAVASAQAELVSAQKNVLIQSTRRKEIVNDKIMYLSGPPEIREKARARATQAQAALDVATANLAQGTLVAPFDGTVASINVEPGEMVAANEAVLILADLSHLQVVTTDLSEREIANVRLGQTAMTRLKAIDQGLPGEVIAIAPLAGLKNGDTVFKVTIELDQQPKGLLWGMTGDVNIHIK